jgi:hypothetical protein
MPDAADRRAADHLLKRQAIQIAAMLPDDTVDALAVLEYARSLLCDFLGNSAPDERKVVPFVQKSG